MQSQNYNVPGTVVMALHFNYIVRQVIRTNHIFIILKYSENYAGLSNKLWKSTEAGKIAMKRKK
jgi:hypothetical protein